ncbi:MAG TPA: response regulator transcription factor [Candidatus Sulfotelmatobacter sp.]|nr:response regulator transcription factor [Candidatus Sulfotelmatobacter sp.]
MNESILIVEDEKALRTTLSDRLRGEGYVVDTAADGHEGFEKATSLPFDLIVLDVMLPFRTGLDVCRDIRQAGMATPILFLTAKDETVDKVVGLKLGADDYVTKPFKSAELIARIEVLLRRVPNYAGKGVHRFASIQIDMGRGHVTRDGKPVYFAGREYQLLRYLVERAGRAIPRDELLRSVWGYNEGTFTRTVDMHISSLRQKLENDPKKPDLILTVPGVGYKFMEPRDATDARGPVT